MPRLIIKPNEELVEDFSFIPLPSSLHEGGDTFLKACLKLNPQSCLNTICGSVLPSSSDTLNEILSSLRLPFRMAEYADEASAGLDHGDQDRTSMRRPLNAVSFDDVARDRSCIAPALHESSWADLGCLSADDKSLFTCSLSSTYRQKTIGDQITIDEHCGENMSVSQMPVQVVSAATQQHARATAQDSSRRKQFNQDRNAPSNIPYLSPSYHHNGYQQQQPRPPLFSYDYQGYYHDYHSKTVRSAPLNNQWPCFQEYPNHTHYSSPNYTYPTCPEGQYPPAAHSQPHSAPPFYHRGYVRTPPPLIVLSQDTKQVTQKFKEPTSAITEGTPSSSQSPQFKQSLEILNLYHDNESENERKPAAKTQNIDNDSHDKRHDVLPSDDFEPLPFWNEGLYPPAASNQEKYRPYAIDQQVVGLPPQNDTNMHIAAGGEGSSWEKRFTQLLEFKSRYGHCEVPQNYKENTSLGIWVNKQRMEHKLRKEGMNSSMNDVRLHRLESVGFRWAKRKGQVSWNEKFEELKAYKKKHGNCHVPTKYKENTALGRWVSTQRSDYKKFCEGKKSNMNEEKMHKLERIGFAWFMAI